MKSPKVRLYIRIRRADSKYAFAKPVLNRNGSIRGGYATVDGVAEHHAEGTYYLRYRLGGKRRQWVPVGNDPERAAVAQRNVEHDLQALGRHLAADNCCSSSRRALRLDLLARDRAIL